MNKDRNSPSDASAEPATTIENSETIFAEEELIHETSTRTKLGAIPSGYGSSGGIVNAPEVPDDGVRDDIRPDDDV